MAESKPLTLIFVVCLAIMVLAIGAPGLFAG